MFLVWKSVFFKRPSFRYPILLHQNQDIMDRRDFIKRSLAVAGGMVAGRVLGAANMLNDELTKKGGYTMDYVTLNNDVQMPILGYGTLRIPVERCA